MPALTLARGRAVSTADAASAVVPVRGWVRRNWPWLLAIVGALGGGCAVAVKRVRDTAARMSSQ
jgi:hypothetical protein